MRAEVAAAISRPALPPLLAAMRPYQWPKNGIVFAALVFSAGDAWKVSEPESWWPLLWRTAALFVFWSMAASAIYLVNDIQDRELDRVHPRKQYRAIASGALGVRTAWTAAIVLGVPALSFTFALDPGAGIILTAYAAMMLAYSAGLKRVPILDIVILCAGVVARASAGAVAISVTISPWLYVCSSFAAFFFASSKRWAEYRQLGPEAAMHRPSLAQYGGELLTQLVTISAATAILSYALYTIESDHAPKNGALALTIPFVAFSVFRYLLLLNGPRKADAPDRILFTDPQILVAVAGFVVSAVAVLILHQS